PSTGTSRIWKSSTRSCGTCPRGARARPRVRDRPNCRCSTRNGRSPGSSATPRLSDGGNAVSRPPRGIALAHPVVAPGDRRRLRHRHLAGHEVQCPGVADRPDRAVPGDRQADVPEPLRPVLPDAAPGAHRRTAPCLADRILPDLGVRLAGTPAAGEEGDRAGALPRPRALRLRRSARVPVRAADDAQVLHDELPDRGAAGEHHRADLPGSRREAAARVRRDLRAARRRARAVRDGPRDLEVPAREAPLRNRRPDHPRRDDLARRCDHGHAAHDGPADPALRDEYRSGPDGREAAGAVGGLRGGGGRVSRVGRHSQRSLPRRTQRTRSPAGFRAGTTLMSVRSVFSVVNAVLILLAILFFRPGAAAAQQQDTAPQSRVLERLRQRAPLIARDTTPVDTLEQDSLAPPPPQQVELVSDTGGPVRRQPAGGQLAQDSIARALMRLSGFIATEYTAPFARYHADSATLRLVGESSVAREGQVLNADSLIVYYRDTGFACGFGRPTLTGEGLDAPLESDSLCYDVTRGVGRAYNLATSVTEQATWFVQGQCWTVTEGG